jgi:Uma2 family endonuclease
MGQPVSMLEQPLVIRTRPAFQVNDDQFFEFCQLNRDLQMERSAEGDILIMAPEAGSSGRGGSKLVYLFERWAEGEGTGQVFGPSTGFTLPSGAIRSPDIAWVRNDRLEALTQEDWNRFLPLCPDFVLELRSPSDSMSNLDEKMAEYRDNGAQLGWLLDPVARQVHVYRAGAAVEIFQDPQSISGEPVLRGFNLDVPQIWAVMQRGGRGA